MPTQVLELTMKGTVLFDLKDRLRVIKLPNQQVRIETRHERLVVDLGDLLNMKSPIYRGKNQLIVTTYGSFIQLVTDTNPDEIDERQLPHGCVRLEPHDFFLLGLKLGNLNL
jgi:hypothetical protein